MDSKFEEKCSEIKTRASSLVFIDLAGSEKIAQFDVNGNLFK